MSDSRDQRTDFGPKRRRTYKKRLSRAKEKVLKEEVNTDWSNYKYELDLLSDDPENTITSGTGHANLHDYQ